MEKIENGKVHKKKKEEDKRWQYVICERNGIPLSVNGSGVFDVRVLRWRIVKLLEKIDWIGFHDRKIENFHLMKWTKKLLVQKSSASMVWITLAISHDPKSHTHVVELV